MKIIRLTAENVKKITTVEISPDGNLVQITGKNGQGKTSVLDAIWWALTGTSNIQAQPIRHGEQKARIKVELGEKDVELVVERKFTEGSKPTLSVMTAEGAEYPKPQEFMNNLLGALTMDPFAFMRKKPVEQFDALRGLLKLDVDPVALDAANLTDFATRTDINRQAKQKRTQAATIVVPVAELEAVDETALLDTISKAAEENADIERRRANRVNASRDIENNTVVLARLRKEVAELAEATAALEEKLAAAGPLPVPVDISAVRAELEAAKSINAAVAARASRAKVEAEAVELEAQSTALTDAMAARTAKKLAAIAKADVPVEGLSLGDNIVTFKGVPLDQASDAEQLTVSLSIATALNPKLRVLRIRDGSLLDDDAMARLAAFADKHDMQVWIERVDGSGTVGFVMEDGHVRGQESAEPVKSAAKSKGSKAPTQVAA
jgi:hypothetical protein